MMSSAFHFMVMCFSYFETAISDNNDDELCVSFDDGVFLCLKTVLSDEINELSISFDDGFFLFWSTVQ